MPPSSTRPLSPHLQIYRWSWTMAMSVFHRITGVALYCGTVFLAIWLLALATGGAFYANIQWALATPFGMVFLFGYTWILMHHMLGGVRHFVWDVGHGFDRDRRISMARLTLIGSIILTLVIWSVAFSSTLKSFLS
jgi:succinate dehydrogenase / fumarate reductase, cytochrome b subunit